MRDGEDLTDAPEDVLWGLLGESEGSARADVLIELARRAGEQGEAPEAGPLLEEATDVAQEQGDLRLAESALYR